MTDDPSLEPHAAVAKVKTRRGISIVWIVPLVALLIGAWLAVKALHEKGPTVDITFVSAEGLEAGKTKVKYKDVEVGTVTDIRLSDDLRRVIVTAELSKDMTKFLTDKTRFWVVRAQIRGGTVSGLGTMFSGAYIGIDPDSGGKSTKHFSGLEVPPVVTTGLPGRHFWLRAKQLGSLTVGAPVYYRQVQVGQVVSHGFSQDDQNIEIQIFVEAPHHAKVTENTRFYNASGVDVTLDAQGMRIETESLVTIVGGGLAFDLPTGTPPGKEADDHSTFTLYPDRASIQQKIYTIRREWLFFFNQSVRGLSLGAPVELYGIKVGEVADLDLQYIADKKDFLVRVLVAIEPERISGINKAEVQRAVAEKTENLVRWLVEERNLRGQLKTGSLLTGQLFIDLGFRPDEPRTQLGHVDGYPVIPTISGSLEQIQENLARITSSIEKVPLQQISNDLRKTLREAKDAIRQTGEFVASLNKETAPQLKATLAELQKTLAELQGTVGRESPLNHSARKTLEELTLTLRSLRQLTDTLESNPESLLFGKGGKDGE